MPQRGESCNPRDPGPAFAPPHGMIDRDGRAALPALAGQRDLDDPLPLPLPVLRHPEPSARPELPTAAWLEVIDQLADRLPRGTPTIFAGGEPFARRDILTLAERALARGLSVNLATIGYYLEGATPNRLRDLPVVLSISLHGYRRTHDRLTRAPGLFARVMNAMDVLAAGSRVSLYTATVITGANLAEVTPLARYLLDQEVVHSIYYQAQVENLAAPARPGWHLDHPAWARDADRAARVLDELIAMKNAGARIANSVEQFTYWKEYFRDPDGSRNHLSCTVGEHNLTILPDGQIKLCDLRAPLGNVADAPVRAVWEGADARAARRAMRDCRIPCNYFVNCVREDRKP